MGAATQCDSMHGMQSETAVVMQNGIQQNRFSGAAIQGDCMHGMQSETALVMQNGFLQNRFSGGGNSM